MRGLNLDQLQTLVEVVEQGSFTAAAKRLNLTQPAVSLQIRELEAASASGWWSGWASAPMPRHRA